MPRVLRVEPVVERRCLAAGANSTWPRRSSALRRVRAKATAGPVPSPSSHVICFPLPGAGIVFIHGSTAISRLTMMTLLCAQISTCLLFNWRWHCFHPRPNIHVAPHGDDAAVRTDFDLCAFVLRHLQLPKISWVRRSNLSSGFALSSGAHRAARFAALRAEICRVFPSVVPWSPEPRLKYKDTAHP